MWSCGGMLLAVALQSIWQTRVDGYEVSFYASLPGVTMPAIWGAFLLFGLGLIAPSIRVRRGLHGAYLLGMTLVSFMLLALPAVRYGTYYTQWDVWYHLGYASSLAASGHVDVANVYYPGLHILWSTLGGVTGLGVYNIGILLGPAIFSIKIPLVYIVTSRAFHDVRTASLSSALAVIPDGLTGSFPAPWFYALVLLLLLVWVILVRQDLTAVASAILTLVVVTAFVFSHPLAPLFLFASVSIIILSPRIFSLVGRATHPRLSQELRPRTALPSLLVYGVVLYVAWISLLTLTLQVQLPRILDALTVGGVINPIRYGHFLTPLLIVETYATTIILAVFSFVAIMVLGLGKEVMSKTRGYTVFAFVISAGILMVATQAIGAGLGLGENATRSISVAMIFLPVLAGYFLGWLWARRPKSRRLAGLVFAMLLVVLVTGSATMYPSPGIALFNYQNTESLYMSVDWAAEYLPQEANVLSNSHVGRYAFYPFQAGDPAFGKLVHFNNSIPQNFSSLWEVQGRSVTYLILDEETVVVGSADLRAWSSPSYADVTALNSVKTVNRLYDNGGVQIYAAGSR